MNPTMPKKPCNQHSLWLRKGFAAFAFLVGFAMLGSAQQASAQNIPDRWLVSLNTAYISKIATGVGGGGTATLTISLANHISS